MGYHPLTVRPPYPPPVAIRDPREAGWQCDKRTPAHAVPFEIVQDLSKFEGFNLPPAFGENINDFCKQCVHRVPEQRAKLRDLLEHKWVAHADRLCTQEMLADYVRLSLSEDPAGTELDEEVVEEVRAMCRKLGDELC